MADEVIEVHSAPVTPNRYTPPISAPPSQMHSPSMSRSPLLGPSTTPRHSPARSPMRKAVDTMRTYLEEVGHATKLETQDAWLPITESRKGNAYYAAFHTLCSGVGFQALVLPVAFTILGWTWGVLFLSLAFVWQLYSVWLLTQLHESVPGTRYSRYVQLAQAAFGEKLAKLLTIFPIIYLSAGTCSALIIVGGGSIKLFYETVCGASCTSKPLTTIEWYLIFTCLATVLAQLPNLNSIAGVSLIGSVTAVSYCTMIWTVSVVKTRPPSVSYNPVKADSDIDRMLAILSALGIIAFAFRGINLTLEIQGTMPSTQKHPSKVPMWRGVKVAYVLIALCLYPIAIGGFWAYGNRIPQTGILTALIAFHGHDTSRVVLALTSLLVVINCLSSFQIYAMPAIDDLESGYTSKKNKPCPKWLRAGIRVFFCAISFFIAVAFPFLADLAGLVGGIALPVSFAYPCFMWILIRKPNKYSFMWCINLVLGSLGVVLSVVLVAGGLWKIVETGIKIRFFKPQ